MRSLWTSWYNIIDVVCAQTPFEEQTLQRVPIKLRIIPRCTNYFIQHIHSLGHRNNIRGCVFNDYILEMEDGFKSKNYQENNLNSAETVNRLSYTD
jgi:hypothetical protein